MSYRRRSQSFFSLLTLPTDLPVRRSTLSCRMFEGANKVNTLCREISSKLGYYLEKCMLICDPSSSYQQAITPHGAWNMRNWRSDKSAVLESHRR